MDMTSPYAKLITSHILKAFDGIKINDKNLKTALELLNEWDYELNKQSQTPAIYILTLKYLLHNIYYDELGEDLFNRFVFLANVPYRSLLQVLEKPESDIFDNINTAKKETKNEIIRKSLADALTYLEKKLGKDLTDWQWGRLHSVTFQHPFSGNFSLLDKYINIGPRNRRRWNYNK